eukprot:5266348-Amphidinium_carterae.1
MLDEPTNHLDWKAILWLEGYLQSAAMEDVALVVVSHDRDFLDNVSSMIMRIHDRQLFFYQGALAESTQTAFLSLFKLAGASLGFLNYMLSVRKGSPA